jgi:hypothetical protein
VVAWMSGPFSRVVCWHKTTALGRNQASAI